MRSNYRASWQLHACGQQPDFTLHTIASVIVSLILKTNEDLSTQEHPCKGTIVVHLFCSHNTQEDVYKHWIHLAAIMKPNCLKSQWSGVNVSSMESQPWQVLFVVINSMTPKVVPVLIFQIIEFYQLTSYPPSSLIMLVGCSPCVSNDGHIFTVTHGL